MPASNQLPPQRRDNGLRADSFTALADVDPRLDEIGTDEAFASVAARFPAFSGAWAALAASSLAAGQPVAAVVAALVVVALVVHAAQVPTIFKLAPGGDPP